MSNSAEGLCDSKLGAILAGHKQRRLMVIKAMR